MVGGMLAAPGISNLSAVAAGVWGAVLVTLLVCAGGYVLNDVASDRVAKPSRPLALGKVGFRGAVVMTVALWGAAGVVAARIGLLETIFCLVWIALLAAYSWRIKGRGLAGNVLVSAVASSGFLLGAALIGKAEAGVLPASISFTIHLGREIAKSASDLRGDAEVRLGTTAVRIGSRAALRLSLWCVAAAFASSVVPFAFSAYGTAYFVAVAAGVFPLLAVSLHRIVTAVRTPAGDDRSQEAAAKSVAMLLKLVMPIGLLAFVLEAV
jgi:4-hydroxybenzoate polyprenyltransferase